jgi:histone H3
MARTKNVPVRNRAAAAENKLKNMPVPDPAAAVGKKERKPHRFKQGTVALREIKRYQKSVETLVPKMPFRRLVREIAAPYRDEDWRFSRSSLEALQEASEAYIVEVFEDTNNCALQSGKRMIKPRHMKLALAMRHNHNLPKVDLPEPVLAASAGDSKKKKKNKSSQKKERAAGGAEGSERKAKRARKSKAKDEALTAATQREPADGDDEEDEEHQSNNAAVPPM